MNSDLDSINLFKGYSQKENEQTHAFLAFLNFLLHTDKKKFVLLWNSLKISRININPSDIEIRCLNYENGTWDGEIKSKKKKWFIAIESKIEKSALNHSQIRRHRFHIAKEKNIYQHVKLVFLTPFDKDWIIKEYLHGKHGNNVSFLSWGDVYKSANVISENLNNSTHKYVVEEYKKYLEAVNWNRTGIIQVLNKEYIEDDFICKIKTGKHDAFHIPSKKIGFDLPNFKVFLYEREKGGISSYFTSNGMFLDHRRERDKSFKHYFTIEDFIELKNPIDNEDIRKLLGKKEMGGKYMKYKCFKKKNCPAPYYVLNAKMVDALERFAKKRGVII